MLLDDLLPTFDATRIEHRVVEGPAPGVGIVMRSLPALVARAEPAEPHRQPTPPEA